jgi:ProP effector
MTSTPPPTPAPGEPMTPAVCAQQLKALFPALFAGAVKPLKLRIQVDIQERAPGVFTKQALSAFFRRHTGSTSYLIAVSKATHRIALDDLARRRASNESRRELEEQQRRNRAGLLRDFQTTTLTRANFCVLKGVADEELDGLLEIARGEAEEQRARPQPAFDPRGPRRPGPPGAGGGQRPPRPR